MVAVAPETIAKDLIQRVNSLILQGDYLDLDSFVIKSLLREVDKLMKFDVKSAHIVKAAIYQVCFDEEKMRDHLRIASANASSSDISVSVDCAVGLSNFGYHSEGQDCFVKFDDPNYLSVIAMEKTFEVGYQTFSLEHLQSLIVKAKKLNLKLIEKDVVLTSKAVAILRENNISDKLLSQYADIAGDVMRENKLMPQDRAPNFEIADQESGWFPPTIFITFKVNADHATAAELYKELTKRLIEKFDDIPDAIHISIASSQ